ncbi:hypothetical protein C8R47DRAFT_294488 [Mycena vitilis]|nr:hypothetical protein C8R47DRAFT_294488 [Mycena vitilis]
MFKKYKAFMNNEGKFEQPGVRALQDFVSLHDRQLRLGHAALAVKAAERRVLEAEEAAREAEARAVMAETFADGQSSLGSGSRSSRETVRRHTRSLRSRASDETGSLVSGETVTRERLFLVPERLSPPPSKPVPSIPTPARTCVLCFDHCFVCPNPWQRTRSDFMVSKAANIGYQKPVPYGLVLQPCGHVFCGACLAQAIYQSLNMAFDRATYGTKLPSYAPDVVGPDRPEFPISCPVCHTRKHGKQREMREIDDTTARLVLGELNMDEWNHARFLSKLRRIHCPHQGCNHNFDADDAIPSSDLPPNEAHVHCPRCKGPLCRPCKSIWHDGPCCWSRMLFCLTFSRLDMPVVPSIRSLRPHSSGLRP